MSNWIATLRSHVIIAQATKQAEPRVTHDLMNWSGVKDAEPDAACAYLKEIALQSLVAGTCMIAPFALFWIVMALAHLFAPQLLACA